MIFLVALIYENITYRKRLGRISCHFQYQAWYRILKLSGYRISGWFQIPDIRLSGNLPDIERWPDIWPDTGYPALEIGPTLFGCRLICLPGSYRSLSGKLEYKGFEKWKEFQFKNICICINGKRLRVIQHRVFISVRDIISKEKIYNFFFKSVQLQSTVSIFKTRT